MSRVIKQERDCIQYTGDNLREVYDFINEHNANANEVTFEELLADKRPESIPMDKYGSIPIYEWLNDGITWYPGEEYHIYLSNTYDDFCYLIGIKKGGWFFEPEHGKSLDYFDDDEFKRIAMEENGWKIEE